MGTGPQSSSEDVNVDQHFQHRIEELSSEVCQILFPADPFFTLRHTMILISN